MTTPDCSEDLLDEMLPRVSFGRKTISATVIYVPPRFTWRNEVEIDPLDERDTSDKTADGQQDMETTITTNQWWPDPIPNYPASSATYVAIMCQYCGGSHHPQQCPRVEEIEYYRSGAMRRVTLRPIRTEVSATFTASWTAPPAVYSGAPS